MSKLHIQQGDGGNRFTVYCHATVPAGNNSAGTSWVTAVKNALNPVTAMSIGNGPGQISTAESNTVASGNVIETSFQFDDDPNWDSSTRTTQLNLIANDAVTRVLNDLSARLKWFGAVVT